MSRFSRAWCWGFVVSAFMALALSWGSVPAASAKQSSGQPVVRLNSTQLVIVVRRLIAAGRFDEARGLVRAYRPSDAKWRFRVAYVDGLVAERQGDFRAAIATFRSILAEHPEYSFVRLDLTQALFMAGQDDAARYNAELLIAAGVDDRIGGGMRNIVGAIDDRRPVRFRGFASLLPSTNINGGTDRKVIVIGGVPFVIDAPSQRQSGLGVLLGGDVLFRQRFSKSNSLVGSLSGTGRFYPSIGRADLVFNGTAGVEHKTARGQIVVSAVARHDFADMKAAFREGGLQFEASRFAGKSGRLYGSLRLTARDYVGETARDSLRAEVNGFYDHFAGPERFVRFLGGAIREEARDDENSFSEMSAGLAVNAELPYGVTLYAQASYAERRYDAPMPVFGVREDHRIDAQVTVTKRNLNFHGFAPQLTYSFTRNFSNDPFEDSTTHAVDLRIVRDF